MANSITGALIVLATSGIALIGYLYEWWPVTSEQWVIVFMIQLSVYFLTYYLTGFGRRVPQTAPGG